MNKPDPKNIPFRLALEYVTYSDRILFLTGKAGTGKTTFLNALLAEIPAEERLILIEDAAELHLRHPNAVGLIAARGELSEARINAEDLLVLAD